MVGIGIHKVSVDLVLVKDDQYSGETPATGFTVIFII